MKSDALSKWMEAVPFEHVLRKREPAMAQARWEIEVNAYEQQMEGRVCLLLSVDDDIEKWLATIASWEMQTWPNCGWIVVGTNQEPWRDHRIALGVAAPAACLEEVKDGDLAACGFDWVIPARPGDMLHPSLAGMVALNSTANTAGVVWDRLEAISTKAGLQLTSRTRGPARDVLAEERQDIRGRAFAVPARAWAGHPVADAWENRVIRGGKGVWQHHPEPLGIYPDDMLPEVISKCDGDWQSSEWGVQMSCDTNTSKPAAVPARVSVIILYRDRVELTLRAVDSLVRQNLSSELEIVLVDNQSCEETKSAINARIAALPGSIKLLQLDYPFPFNHSRQCCFGADAATGDVLVFLNNDAEILSIDGLEHMGRWALVPGVATVGVKMVDGTGAGVGGGFRARRLPGAEFNSPVEEAAGFVAEMPRHTIGNTFACVAVSATAFRSVGGLDGIRFPVGFNDVDFCLRAIGLGWKHINLAHISVSHAVGASRPKADEIAQKLALRKRYPWVANWALSEIDREAISHAPVRLPFLSSL